MAGASHALVLAWIHGQEVRLPKQASAGTEDLIEEDQVPMQSDD